jgi:hypothetical protein
VRRCVAVPVVPPGTWLAPPENNYIRFKNFYTGFEGLCFWRTRRVFVGILYMQRFISMFLGPSLCSRSYKTAEKFYFILHLPGGGGEGGRQLKLRILLLLLLPVFFSKI